MAKKISMFSMYDEDGEPLPGYASYNEDTPRIEEPNKDVRMVSLTIKEFDRAFTWAKEHNRAVHNDELINAEMAIRNIRAGGIGMRTVVTCEACERVRVDNRNRFDVTDFDCW